VCDEGRSASREIQGRAALKLDFHHGRARPQACPKGRQNELGFPAKPNELSKSSDDCRSATPGKILGKMALSQLLLIPHPLL